jgi:outer membrane protein OmpA-like peptidoglycan-associated protein
MSGDVMRNGCIFFAIFGLMLTGCSGTTVVLVPDAAGKVGKVSVKTEAGEQVLSQSGASTFASKMDKIPTPVQVLDSTKIQKMFGIALANEPAPPLHYSIYFQSGSAELLPDSKSLLMTVFKAIQERKSCDTSVIGHSDRVGDNSTNKGISLKRAESVANVLKAIGLSGDCLDVRYYGENDPVVPTADEVAEPKNRRVEIEVR